MRRKAGALSMVLLAGSATLAHGAGDADAVRALDRFPDGWRIVGKTFQAHD